MDTSSPSQLTEHNWADLPGRAMAVFDRLHRLGIRVPPGSRFTAHTKVAELLAARASADVLRLDDPVARVYGALELREFCATMEVLLAEQPSRACLETINMALAGPVLPQHEDGASSRPRNAQFELALGAMCKRAGLPVTWAEPDVVTVFDGRRVGFAAKRLASKRTLQQNVTKAQEQIARARLWGVIAVDISRPAHPSNQPVPAADRQAIERANEEYFAEFERVHVPEIRNWIKSRNVLGTLVRLRVHAHIPGLGVSTHQTHFITEVHEPDPVVRGLFYSLFDRLRVVDLDGQFGGTV